jgi:type II secretory pathway component PulC
MRTRTLKHLLSVLTLLLFIAAVVVVVLSMNLPIDVPGVQDQPVTGPMVEHIQPGSQRVPELRPLQKLASVDLRQRLFDPPPEPKPVIPPKPPPSIRLMGTIVNATNPRAMIAGKGGVELKRVGDTIGSRGNTAVIREIHSDHIKIEHEGQLLDVTIIDDTRRSR